MPKVWRGNIFINFKQQTESWLDDVMFKWKVGGEWIRSYGRLIWGTYGVKQSKFTYPVRGWRGRPRVGSPSRSTWYTATCGTCKWSWRGGITTSHATPNVIFLFPGGCLMARIIPRRCASRGCSGNPVSWERRRCRQVWWRPYRPATDLWIWWRNLNNLGWYLTHLTTTGWWWFLIFGWHRVDSHVSQLFWGGRGQTPVPTVFFKRLLFR